MTSLSNDETAKPERAVRPGIRGAPTIESLPAAVRRSVRGGPPVAEISLVAELTTPILGGAHATRTVDEVDVVRAASLRGHLRFWWRALRGHEFASAAHRTTA